MTRRQQTSDARAWSAIGTLAVIGAAVLLSGCNTVNRLLLPTNQQPIVTRSVMPPPIVDRAAATPDAAAPGATTITAVPGASTTITATPALPPDPSKRPPTPAKPPPFPADERREISLNFDQAPLPTFIQVVFGNVLKANVLVDPAVAQRQDLVTLRTGKPQNRNEVLETVRLLLKTYGVAVIDVGGAFRIVPDATAPTVSPDIQRGRALPDVPQAMRPVFHLYELQAVRVQEVSQWLKTIFGNRVTFTEDAARNALLISGMPESVAAVIEAIEVLDQPLLRGRSSVRIEPAYWTADELARRLVDILTAQGYSAGTVASGTQPTILLPVAAINSIIAFSVSRDVLEFVTRWVRELDQPGRALAGGATGIFTYSARNTDARELARTLQEILAGSVAAPAAPAAPGQPPRPQTPARVVVHAGTNTLIFQGAAESYTQLVGLLQELDRPARTALIEVTVAELRLSELENLGIEWSVDRVINGYSVRGGTLNNLGIGSDGLLVSILSPGGSTRMLINALASSNRARILSSPRLMARNGEQATIQVGQEVPIITSQQTTPANNIPGSILQTIQYRQTGVILRVRPIIHSGGRIELDVTQEVSAATQTSTGVNNSPTILVRKVETRLALADGNTVALAGLISQNDTRGDSGVPILKDVPVIGQLFRVNTDTSERTELIVLITPYVVNNDFEARAITDAFRSQLGPWAQPVGKPAISLPALNEPQSTAIPAPMPPSVPLPVAPAPKAAPAAASADTEPRAAPPVEAAPSARPPAAPRGLGPKVEDPKLLEELQRSIGSPPNPSPRSKGN